MTDAISALEYPHWLIVVGAILVMLGFFGIAFRQGKGVEVIDESTELAPTQANRKAKLAEQTRSRWAKSKTAAKVEPPDDIPNFLTRKTEPTEQQHEAKGK